MDNEVPHDEKPNDDINDKEMPLLEHLAELRRRLIWSAGTFFVAFIICYHFAPRIYEFLAAPLAHALEARGEKPQLIYTALYEAFFTYVKVAFWAAMLLSFPVIASQVWKFSKMAGCTPATSAASTTKAGSTSSVAREKSSSILAATTSISRRSKRRTAARSM